MNKRRKGGKSKSGFKLFSCKTLKKNKTRVLFSSNTSLTLRTMLRRISLGKLR
jgi:hypothetical protein